MDLMKFENFTKEIVDKVKEFLPEAYADADVRLQLVNKNNGLKLTGLTIRSIDSNVSPTIYLEKYYEDYVSGEDISEILSKIAKIRVDNEVSNFETDLVTNFETAKERIIPRLINAEMNKDTLSVRPHKIIADLAVIYTILLDSDSEGSASVTVTNDILKLWGISVDELHEVSISNLKKVQHTTFKGMSEVMAEMMGINVEDMGMPEEDKMYVLTNRNKSFGAAVLLDSEMMNHITDRFGSVFVIFSSVHEILIILIDENMNVEDLKAMVHEVNETQVTVEERLSDNVYIYTANNGLLVA